MHPCTHASQVIDCQKYWAFESDSYGLKDRILFECTAVLQRSLATVHAKAERKRNEKEAAELFEQQRREAVRMAMLDDRLERKVREEALAAAAAAHAAVPASALPSQTPAPAAAAGGRPPDADSDDDEDE
uniref:Uncharacterized protein n=1 Tax=Chlamydomonas euryale TaxID=1486919 RepID=A0A6U2J5B9_9CHLO|mmetsp:Transcript_5086/g.15437  ORF Transcript_5086/g.15437 Transcript_5086/m.15437 type:complete len:130 (+) Transcript_5086:2172-2561(+)